jgi:uncharacterized protein (TIGR00266 family)
MFCTNCGTTLSESVRFCTKCGLPVAAAPPPPPTAPQLVAVPPPVATPVQVAPPPPPPPPPSAPFRSLRFEVFGGNLPAVAIRLDAGESVYTQSGGMAWMDAGIRMDTNMKGGFMKGLGRMMSGESLFMATYTATAPGQEFVATSTMPGCILPLELRGNAIIAQRSSFLVAQPSIQLSAYVTRSFGAGLFGGEGFILQRITGMGYVFLEIDGSLKERVLAPGETIKVDTGHVAAFEESVQFQAEMVKGFKNVLFGGEGLFLSTLTGPGRVWLQSITLPGFAKEIYPFLPKPSSN